MLAPFPRNLLLAATLAAPPVAVALAQTTQTLEFTAGQGNPTGTGATTSDQVITFQTNRDNPSGNTFITQTPVTTATFALSSQVYSNSSGGSGVVFGGQSSNATAQSVVPAAFALFPLLNGLSGSSSSLNSLYTSNTTVTTGTGIFIDTNRSVELFTDEQYVESLVASRTAYATLTITFSQTVTNPVLQLTGLGTSGGNGASTELELLTSGVTLSKLSGSGILSVSSTAITNSATNTFTSSSAAANATTDGAASGSVLVSGSVSRLQFRIYLNKKTGYVNGNAGYSYGDGWLLGISYTNPSPLPVTLVSFAGRASGADAQLTWTTASELQNDYFAVERSLDGVAFTAVGQVAGQGSKPTATTYTYTDHEAGRQVTGPVYYRLRQVDWDGTATYSPVRTVHFGEIADPVAEALYPNPAAETTTLDLRNLPEGRYRVRVLDATGRTVLDAPELAGGQAHPLAVANLPAGVYVVRLEGTTFVWCQRLVRR